MVVGCNPEQWRGPAALLKSELSNKQRFGFINNITYRSPAAAFSCWVGRLMLFEIMQPSNRVGKRGACFLIVQAACETEKLHLFSRPIRLA